mmetsp:Transcript_70731/g.188036  ORF Transcript_70731/g.188036 Transcript_70731/m.188036 type:complete len:223 (-) Transcript_70731:36-704(-)
MATAGDAEQGEEERPLESSGAASPSRYEGEKANFWEFILHEHSILSLCFAKEGRAVEVPCCACCTTCGCIEMEETFSIRQRIFVFLLVLMACTWVSIDVTTWHHGFWWTVCVTTCILMPLTCWLKRAVPRVRAKLAKFGGWTCPIIVGMCVLAGGAYAIYWEVLQSKGEEKGAKLLRKTLYALGLQMALEFPTLVYKYFCCSICCSCCMPEKKCVRASSEFF